MKDKSIEQYFRQTIISGTREQCGYITNGLMKNAFIFRHKEKQPTYSAGARIKFLPINRRSVIHRPIHAITALNIPSSSKKKAPRPNRGQSAR